MATTNVKLKHKIIEDDVFEAKVILLWGGDYNKAVEFMAKNYGIDIEGNDLSDIYSYGFTSERLSPDMEGWAMWLKNPKDMRDIVHEVIHLIYRIFDYKSVDLQKCEEVFAFYASHWVKKICKATH